MVKPEDVKRVAKYAAGVLGAIAIAVAGTIFGVKNCKGESKEDKETQNKACVSCDSLRNDLVASRDTIVMLQDSLQSVCDSAYIWKAGRDSLQLENDSLKNVVDSLNLELTDCQNSKISSASQNSSSQGDGKGSGNNHRNGNSNSNRSTGNAGAFRQQEPAESKSAQTEPCKQDSVKSTGTVIIENAYEGGVINNYFGEQKAAEEYKQVQYKNGYVLTGERVRCK